MGQTPGAQAAPDRIQPPLTIALPIVHCSADFRRPLVCGDLLSINLEPRQLDPGSFEVIYSFACAGQSAAQGLTRHRAISVTTRQGCTLPDGISAWLKASLPAGEPSEGR